MRELGPANVDEHHDRYAALTNAFTEVQSITASNNENASSEVARTSQELVARSLDNLSSALRLFEIREQNQAFSDSTPERKVEVELRESRASSRIEATKDFRKSRTYPFAGISGAIAIAWGAREPLGITDLHVPDLVYFAGAAAGIVVAAVGYWVVHANQERDERVLDTLYETEVQEAALTSLAEHGHFLFDKSAYVGALRGEVEDMGYVHLFRHFRPRLGSTVNLIGALRDAAALGLDRFVAAGTLNKKQNGVGTVYEIPDEHRPNGVSSTANIRRGRRPPGPPMS